MGNRIKLILLMMLTSLSIFGQEKVSMEFGSNILGYKSQFQNQELFVRGMYEFPTDYVGYWQFGVGVKLSSNIDGFDNVSEIIIYNGYNFKGFTCEKLGVSVNASFNLNSFSLLFVTSLGVQLQVSYEIFDGVSLFANVDNVSHLERDELYPDTLIRNMLKQNISIYGGVKIDIFDTRY
jgi:hypothetical protein